jgi:hypothetical protein
MGKAPTLVGRLPWRDQFLVFECLHNRGRAALQRRVSPFQITGGFSPRGHVCSPTPEAPHPCRVLCDRVGTLNFDPQKMPRPLRIRCQDMSGYGVSRLESFVIDGHRGAQAGSRGVELIYHPVHNLCGADIPIRESAAQNGSVGMDAVQTCPERSRRSRRSRFIAPHVRVFGPERNRSSPNRNGPDFRGQQKSIV